VELSQRCCWAGGSAEWGIYRGSRAGREAEKDCGWAAAAQERSLEPRNRSELRRTDQDLGRGSLETDSYSLEARNGSLCRGNRSRARVQSECLNSDSIGSHTPSFNICSDMAPGPPRPMTITIFLGTTMLVWRIRRRVGKRPPFVRHEARSEPNTLVGHLWMLSEIFGCIKELSAINIRIS